MQQMQQFSKKAHHNHLLFLPLGGAGEIGMNLSLYHYQGKWLIVDIGIGFTDSRFPGADIMIPDISFLRENIKNIVGIIVTHAHEDHLGGIPYLSDELNIPIYATPFSAAILKVKFKEMGNNSGLIKVVPINERFDIDVFNIEMIGMTPNC